MTAPDRETPSTSWAVWAWQAYRDGRLVEASETHTPLADALAVPEIAALVYAATLAKEFLAVCDYQVGRDTASVLLTSALRAIGEGRNG